MKIARLLMVLFALSATVLSAATLPSRPTKPPKSKGGLQMSMDKAAGGYYYCYSDYIVKDCNDYWDCMSSCEIDCGGPCDDEGGWTT